MKEKYNKIQDLLTEVTIMLVDRYNEVHKIKPSHEGKILIKRNTEKNLEKQIHRINLIKNQIQDAYFENF